MSYDNILEARVKEAKEAGSDNSHLLSFEKDLCYGILKTYDENYIGSSLMSTSALFRGTYNLVNSSCERADSYDDETIISSAQKGNKSTGLVTTMRLTDPLPATLYGIGHGSGVSECPELANVNCTDASHILIHGKISSRMDVIFGNGHGILGVDANDLDHKVTECHRVDGRNLINEWKSADPKRVYFGSAEEFSKHKINSGENYLGTFLESKLNETKELNDVVIKAIQVLKSNINGYFLVVIIDDVDAVKMTLTLSRLVRRVKMVISRIDTILIATSDYIYPKENCNGEVVKDDLRYNKVPANSETEMKMPMTREKNTSKQNNNSRSASAKIRVMYPCNHSGSPSKNLHVPFYSSRACGRAYEYIVDQAKFGY
ncbi:hypothetical protein J437_LFUL015106 [Ladona fulva]|uniref:alkaline phosphatase n=1 Tax=Ladona fulva TaxID=123851 RepID=A0A8K0K5M5_LADFU|nr:hypothetical protein J437_LFUL015106 [Ladona fulva]